MRPGRRGGAGFSLGSLGPLGWLEPAISTSGAQNLPNFGSGGGTATLGADTGVAADDPTWRTGYLEFRTNDHLLCPSGMKPPATATDSATWLIVGRSATAPAFNSAWLCDRSNGTGAGVIIRDNTTTGQLIAGFSNGTTTAVSATVNYTIGNLVVVMAGIDASNFYTQVDGGARASVARTQDGTTAQPLVVAARPNPIATNNNLDVYLVLTWSRLISEAEFAQVRAYATGKWT